MPKYIPSETEGENTPLTSAAIRRQINGLDIGPHQIVESDEEDIPAYGFPSQRRNRNRRNGGDDIDAVLGNGGK